MHVLYCRFTQSLQLSSPNTKEEGPIKEYSNSTDLPPQKPRSIRKRIKKAVLRGGRGKSLNSSNQTASLSGTVFICTCKWRVMSSNIVFIFQTCMGCIESCTPLFYPALQRLPLCQMFHRLHCMAHGGYH